MSAWLANSPGSRSRLGRGCPELLQSPASDGYCTGGFASKNARSRRPRRPLERPNKELASRGSAPALQPIIRIGMSRTSRFLLAAALAFLVLPSYGTAQAPRRPATPFQAAVRALNEGRYDEVDAAVEKLDTRDPAVTALKARAAIARGRYDAADALLRPVVARAPQSDAALELGLLMQMLGRRDAKAILEKVATLADTSNDSTEVARAARALRPLSRFEEANAAFREAASGLPGDPAVQTGWGELFLEKYNTPDALRSFQMAMQVDARWTPALLGAAKALSEDNPPQAVSLAKRALEVNPSYVDAMVFLAGEAADAGQHDEAKQTLEKAIAVNPSH